MHADMVFRVRPASRQFIAITRFDGGREHRYNPSDSGGFARGHALFCDAGRVLLRTSGEKNEAEAQGVRGVPARRLAVRLERNIVVKIVCRLFGRSRCRR